MRTELLFPLVHELPVSCSEHVGALILKEYVHFFLRARVCSHILFVSY